MEIVQPTEQGISRAIQILHDGGTVAHATETCYGLACDLRNKNAVERLFKQKQRPGDSPVSALFESIDQAKHFTEWNDLADQLAHQHLPGPLTIILPLKHESGLFPTISGGETLGIRISPHPTAMELVKKFGSPISTTSANVHGEPNTYSSDEIVAQFKGDDVPDLILDSGTLEERSSSSVVSVVGESVEIVRKGDLSL